MLLPPGSTLVLNDLAGRLHVFQYNHYEPTALKKLMSRDATCGNAKAALAPADTMDAWLRPGTFVDLARAGRASTWRLRELVAARDGSGPPPLH